MNRYLSIFLLLFLLAPGFALAYETPEQAIEHQDFAAAETMVRAKLQGDPQNGELTFQLARILSWQGYYEPALELYARLLTQESNNGDYLLGQAQTLFWSGQSDNALLAAKKGLAIAPDSLDLQRLQTQIQSARAAEASIPQAEPAFVPRREVEAGMSYEHLTNGYAEWKSGYLQGEWLYAPRQVLYGTTRLTDRFSQTDQELTLGTYQPLGDLYDVQLEVSGSPSYEILPKYSLFGGISRKLPDKWDASLGARHSEYSATYSNLYSATLGRYFANERLDYTLYMGKAEGASETYAHRVQWTHFYEERNRIGVYVAAGQETENSGEPGPNQLISSNVFTVGLAGRHWLPGDRWALSYELWRHGQGDYYTRLGGALGLRLQF